SVIPTTSSASAETRRLWCSSRTSTGTRWPSWSPTATAPWLRGSSPPWWDHQSVADPTTGRSVADHHERRGGALDDGAVVDARRGDGQSQGRGEPDHAPRPGGGDVVAEPRVAAGRAGHAEVVRDVGACHLGV